MAFNINAQVRLLPPTNAAQMFASLRTQFQGLTATLSVKIPPSSQRQLKTANKSLTAVAKNAKDGSGAMSDFGKQAALAGKRFFAFTLATTAILKFVGALKEGISEAIGFQRELVKISQVTGNSLTNLQALTKEITLLSTKFGVASSQLLKASRILSQTGLSAKDTQTALEALAKSDVAPTFDDIIKTTEGSIAIFRQFGLEAEELEGVLGSINAVSGKFAVESSDIIAAVRRTGGAFAAAGGSVEDLIGLFTSVRATTRESAESIATGFRTIFTRLQRVRTQNFLGTLGIELQDAAGQFVGPLEAIRQLSTALTDLKSTDPRFAQIIEELGGFRQVSKVIPLIQQFSTAEKARAVAIAGTNSLTEDAETAQQALSIQIKKTREEFIAMIRAFTDSSTFQGGIKLVLKMAEAFVKVAEALEPLLPLLGTLAIAGIGSVAPRLYKQFSSAGGFGFSGKHEGGFIHKFQTGGLVPGVGNSDTVPASLTPGEFVVRKAAVETIGAGTLQGLNKGGSLQRFAYGGYNRKRELLEGKRKLPEAEKGLELSEKSLKGKQFDDIRKEGGITKLGKQQFGVVFAKEKANTKQPSGSQPEISLRNVTDAISRDKSNRATKSPVGTQVALDGNKNPSSLVKFNVVRGFVSDESEKDIEHDGRKGFESLMQTIGKKLVPNAKRLKNVEISNWPTISGLMFEGIIARLGAPYLSDEKDVDTASSDRQTWDFPHGIRGRAGRLFNDRRLRKIPTDAKRSSDKKIKESLKKKISNTIASKIKGGGEYEGFKLLADGGYGSVNALLTPGEFVVNKSTASRLGPSTLNSLNHADKLPGFASGGYARGSGNVFRARRLRLDEQGQLTPQAKEYARRRTERMSKLGGKTARVFDFDDTLATTAAKRFEDFRGDRAKNFISTAKTTGYTMVAKKAADHGQHVFVLTARSSVSKKPIQDFATRAGIPLPASRIITVADDPELNDLREPGAKPNTTRKASTATKKHAILSKLSSLYENIVFYDNNRDNILKAATVPKVKAKHVKVQPYAEGGSVPFSADPSPVRPADEGSRQQYLNFLLNKRLISLFDVKDFNDRFKIPMNKLVDSRVVVEILKSPNKDRALDFIPRGSELVGSGVEALVFSDKQRAYRLARKGVRGAPIQRPKSTAILQALQTLDFGNVYGEVLPLAQPLNKNKRYNKLNELDEFRRHRTITGALKQRLASEGFDVSEGNYARGEDGPYNIGIVKENKKGKSKSSVKLIDPGIFRHNYGTRKYAEGGSVAGGGHYAVSSDTIGFSPKIVKELLEQIPANIKVNFVIGPAGSGKTTYTQKMGAQPLLDPEAALSARELTFESASQKIANIVPLVNKTQASGGFGILLDPAASVVKSQRDKRVKAKEAGKSFAFDKRSAAALKGTSYAPVSQGKEFIDELKQLFPALQVKKFARGGIVPGVGNRDTVPAMLTPGEAVLSTSTVQQLNKGGIVRSYAGGGPVGGGGGIGNFAAIGFALAGISSLVSSFQGLNKGLDATLNAITSVASQFGLLYFATNSLISGVGKFDKKIEASKVKIEDLRNRAVKPKVKEEQARRIANKLQARPSGTDPQSRDRDRRLHAALMARAAAERATTNDILKRRQVQRQAIRQNQSLAKQTQFAAIGLGLFVSALNTYATYLEKKGREDIEQGRGSSSFIQAKAIKGGTTGATVGGLVGAGIGTLGIPGLGTALGATIGATVGGGIGAGVGTVSGKGQARGITLLSEFNKGLEVTNRKLAAIGKGTTDFATQRTSLLNYINDTRESLFNKELTPEGRKDVVAGFKAQLDGLGSFFRDIATKSTSFEAFIEDVGQGTFDSFSDLSGIPITELNEQFKQTVKTSVEAREKALKLTKATDEYADQIRRLIGLSRAFNDVTLTMQKLKGTVETLVAFANGAAGGFRVSDDSARLSKPAEFFDSEKFSAIVARDITNNEALQTTFPGEDASVGAKFGKEVNQAQNIVQQLPAVLLKLRNSVGEFSAEDAVGKLLDEFEGAPPLVLNALRDAANKIIGTEGKEEKLIAEMQKDLLGVAKKLGEGFAPTFETAAKISKAMQTEKNRRLSLVDQLTSLISKEMELRNRSVDIERQREELLAKAGNRPADLNKLQTLDNQKLKNIGAGADPRIIGLRLETAKNKLLQLQIKYDEKRLKSGDKLEEQIKAQKETITRSSAALAHLSDVGARTAVTMQKIDRAQATAQFKQGLLERGASAETPSEVRSMFIELRSARVAQATGTLNSVRPESRSEVLQLFKNLGPGRLSAFGGESGTEIYQRLLADFAQQMGLNAEDAKKLAAGQSSEIDKLTASLTTIINAAADANKVQIEGLESANAKLLKALDDSINNFGKIVKEMLMAQRAQELEKEIKGQEGTIANKQTSADNLKKFIKDFGGPGGDEKRARLIGQNLQTIKDIDVATKRKKAVGQLVDYGSSITEYDLTREIPFAYGGRQQTAARPPDNILARKLLESGGLAGDKEFRLNQNQVNVRIDKLANVIAKGTGNDKNAIATFRQSIRGRLNLSKTGGTISVGAFKKLIPDALHDTTDILSKDFDKLSDMTSNLTIDLGGLGHELTEEERNLVLGSGTEKERDKHFGDLVKEFQTFAKIEKPLIDLKNEIATLNGKLTEKRGELDALDLPERDRRGGLIGFNRGGVVPGFGNRDKVPALLTPGEVVLPKMQGGGSVKELLEKIEAQNVENRKAEKTRRQGAVVELDTSAKTRRDARKKTTDENIERIEKNKNKFSAEYTIGGERKTFDNKDEYINTVREAERAKSDKRTRTSLENVLLRKQAAGETDPDKKAEILSGIKEGRKDPLNEEQRRNVRARREAKRKSKYDIRKRKYGFTEPFVPITDEDREARRDQAEHIAAGGKKGYSVDEYNDILRERRRSRNNARLGRLGRDPIVGMDRHERIENAYSAKARARGVTTEKLRSDEFRALGSSIESGIRSTVGAIGERLPEIGDTARDMFDSSLLGRGISALGYGTVGGGLFSVLPGSTSKVPSASAPVPPVPPASAPPTQTVEEAAIQPQDTSLPRKFDRPYQFQFIPRPGGDRLSSDQLEQKHADQLREDADKLRKSMFKHNMIDGPTMGMGQAGLSPLYNLKPPTPEEMAYNERSAKHLAESKKRYEAYKIQKAQEEQERIKEYVKNTTFAQAEKDKPSLLTRGLVGLGKGAGGLGKGMSLVGSLIDKAKDPLLKEVDELIHHSDNAFVSLTGRVIRNKIESPMPVQKAAGDLLGEGFTRGIGGVMGAGDIVAGTGISVFQGDLTAAKEAVERTVSTVAGGNIFGFDTGIQTVDKTLSDQGYDEEAANVYHAGLAASYLAPVIAGIPTAAKALRGPVRPSAPRPNVPRPVPTRTTPPIPRIRPSTPPTGAVNKAIGGAGDFIGGVGNRIIDTARKMGIHNEPPVIRKPLVAPPIIRKPPVVRPVAPTVKPAVTPTTGAVPQPLSLLQRMVQVFKNNVGKADGPVAKLEAKIAKIEADGILRRKQAAPRPSTIPPSSFKRRPTPIQKDDIIQLRGRKRRSLTDAEMALQKAELDRQAFTQGRSNDAKGFDAPPRPSTIPPKSFKRRLTDTELALRKAESDRQALIRGRSNDTKGFPAPDGYSSSAAREAAKAGKNRVASQSTSKQKHLAKAEKARVKALAQEELRLKKAGEIKDKRNATTGSIKPSSVEEVTSMVENHRLLLRKFEETPINDNLGRQKLAAEIEKSGKVIDAEFQARISTKSDITNQSRSPLNRAKEVNTLKSLKRLRVGHLDTRTVFDAIVDVLDNKGTNPRAGLALNKHDWGVDRINYFIDIVRRSRETGFQSGAFVPGIGSGDKVRALLEPGEFVLNRNAVRAAGPQNLDRFNKQHSRFQKGGPVGMQNGGSPPSIAMPDLTAINEVLQQFGTKVDLLANSLSSINGLEIQLVATHKVEVIINGAQVLQQLAPSVENLVIGETGKAINGMLKEKFPDVGQIA